ncbi:MAG TPA: ADYC domain-containing protein [Kofleriaceae bacterium]|jgi:hypothetical protein
MSDCLPWTLIALAACSAACADPTSDATTGEATSWVVPDPTCDDFICGGNSATLGDGVVFDELNTNGLPDVHRVRIIDATYHDPDTLVDVAVHLVADRDRLTAVAADGTTYAGFQLVHVSFRLFGPSGGYNAEITDVENEALHFWANDPARTVPPADDQHQYIQFYRIIAWRFTDSRQDARPICPSDVRHQPDWGNFWAPVEHSAVVFEGDRYDPQHKIVSDVTWTTPWFNLACAGSVPAKMLLMRRTNAASFGRDGVRWYTLSTRERQAMLKMFTADYCGTGQAFTVDGQPLIWWESHHWYDETPLLGLPAPRPVASVEALWDENGALCLTTPRMAVPWTGPPTTVDEVRQACPAKNLRDCPTDLTGWETYAKVLTLNPVF